MKQFLSVVCIKKYILIVLSFYLMLCCSQTKDNTQLPHVKEYLDIVYEQCKNPDIIEVETTYDGYIEVEYICNGVRYEIGIRDNNVLYRERALTKSQVPFDKITRKLKKNYSTWKIDEISQITVQDTSFLKVEVIKDGIEQNLYFTTDGKWYKIKPLNIESQFDFDAIEKTDTYIASGYNFNNPTQVYEMPDVLREISGIELCNDSVLYCVQDELGAVFEFDMKTHAISKSHRFTDIGDFEGVASHENMLYILRSDGCLFSYNLQKPTQVSKSMMQISSLNIEGLCYFDSYLYVASKEPLVHHTDDIRIVHRVSVTDYENLEEFMEIRIQDITTFLQTTFSDQQISTVRFNPSSIAIHPITHNIYILSATDRFVAIYTPTKQLLSVIPLSPDVYYKPEGISFYSNGDMLISSEGDKKGFVKGSINFIPYNLQP